MPALNALNAVIGVVFVFLLLSTLCAALREALEARLKTRAAYLERGLRELLQDREGTGLVRSLLEHPLLAGLFLGTYQPSAHHEKLSVLAIGRGLPSYIPAKSFAIALLDLAGRGAATDEVSADPASEPLTVDSIRERLLNIDNLPVRRVLLTALDASHGDLDLAASHVETWFNSAMDRVSGWYKRSTQWIVLFIALALTVAMNVDTLALLAHFYGNEEARAAIVGSAEVRGSGEPQPGLEAAHAALNTLQLPIGWDEEHVPDGFGWVNRILGWLISAVAATLGAPFWFDVLNKVMVIRSTVKPREKSQEEGSEDRPLRRQAREATVAIAPSVAASPMSQQTTAWLERPYPRVLMPRDPEAEQDGCSDMAHDETPDDALPQAEGGLA